MGLRGCTGVVVLSNMLHVLELEHPHFLVRQAVACGWEVLFALPEQFRGAGEVVVVHEGCVVLTGRARGQLFLFDDAPCVTAGSAVFASVQQLTQAWECHRRLGRVFFRS
jgi:hypothetical protein